MMSTIARPSDRTARVGPFALAVLVTTFTLAPARATFAQDAGLIEGYAGRMRTANNRVLGGLSLSGYSGPFGLRLSGGLNLRYDDLTDQTQTDQCRHKYVCTPSYDDSFGPAVDAWSFDADLLFVPFRQISALRAVVMGFSPYAFVGFGKSGVTPRNGFDTSATSVSYGLGAYRSLFERLGISGEARYRRPVQSAGAVLTVAKGSDWEYRFGLSISLGPDKHSAMATTIVPVDSGVVAARRAEDAAMAAEAKAKQIAHVLDGAEELVGTPYQRGGASEAGLDAAGLVQFLFKREGVDVSGTARELAKLGSEVSLADGQLSPGDIMLFANDGMNVDHVAIYVGDARFVHATESGGGVRYDELGRGSRGRWFFEHFVSARRVLDGHATQSAAPVDDGRDPPDRAPKPMTPPSLR